jgi:predicted Zn-dependent protease
MATTQASKMKDYSLLSNTELLLIAANYLRANQADDAISTLRSLLERNPNDANALYLLAVQHAALGLVDDAQAEFESALDIAPGLHDARLQYAILLLSMNAQERAQIILAPLAQGTPIGLHQSLANVLMRHAQNDQNGAQAALNALATPPDEYQDLVQCIADFIRRSPPHNATPRPRELGRYKQYN